MDPKQPKLNKSTKLEVMSVQDSVMQPESRQTHRSAERSRNPRSKPTIWQPVDFRHSKTFFFLNPFRKKCCWGWKDDSAVKVTGCFQKVWVRYPASAGWLMTACNSSCRIGYPLTSAGLMHVVHRHTCKQNTQTCRINNRSLQKGIYFSVEQLWNLLKKKTFCVVEYIVCAHVLLFCLMGWSASPGSPLVSAPPALGLTDMNHQAPCLFFSWVLVVSPRCSCLVSKRFTHQATFPAYQ